VHAILYIHVHLFLRIFVPDFLTNVSELIVFVFPETFSFVSCFKMFLFQKLETLYRFVVDRDSMALSGGLLGGPKLLMMPVHMFACK